MQVEFHPKLYQKELLEYCKRKGIQLQAYTSLGQGKVCYSAWTFYYCEHDFEEACYNAPACKENCTMEVIVHADDNFLFRDKHKFGLRKICKLLLVYLTLINDYSWDFCFVLKALR